MNYIFIVLFIIVFYWIFKQKKRADRELFKKQITDSLFLGVIEYCKFQLSDLGFWVDNKDNPNNKDQINEIKQRFFDLTLGEIYFYKRIIDSFESHLSEEEWNKFDRMPCGILFSKKYLYKQLKEVEKCAIL